MFISVIRSEVFLLLLMFTLHNKFGQYRQKYVEHKFQHLEERLNLSTAASLSGTLKVQYVRILD